MASDKTNKLAEKTGAKVIVRNANKYDNFTAVQDNVNYAIDQAKGEWILRVDADEVVTPELKEEIIKLLNDSDFKYVAFGIPRRQYFWGGFLRGGDWAYDRLVRLFKKGYARYDPIVAIHEQFKVDGKIGYLKNPLLHFSHPTLKDAWVKFQKYTDVQIHDLHMSKLHAFYNLLTQPSYVFLRWMIWHRGYRDGLRGMVAGLMRGSYDALLYWKYLIS